jgi:hypothetical protein
MFNLNINRIFALTIIPLLLVAGAGTCLAQTNTTVFTVYINQPGVNLTPATGRFYAVGKDDIKPADDTSYSIPFTYSYSGVLENAISILETGDDVVCLVERETSPGTASHQGFYVVTSEEVTVSGIQLYDIYVPGFRAIPVPLSTFEGGVVNLSWTAAIDDGTGNIIGYNIYRSSDGVSFDATPVNPTPIAGTSATDSTVVLGSTYFYSVKVVFRGTLTTPEVETLYFSGNSAPVYIGTVGALIISVDPYFAFQGQQNLSLFIVGSGTHFTASSEIDLGQGITVESVTWNGDPTQLTVIVSVDAGAVVGSREVVVTTGGEIAVGTGLFWVVPSGLIPSFTLTPGKGVRGARLYNVKVAGTNTNFTTSSEVISDSELDLTWIRTISGVSAEVDLSVAVNAQYERKPVFIMTANEFAMGTFEVSLMDMDPELIPNFPNPFDPQVEVTHMMIQLEEPTEIGIYIYDMTARQIWKEVIFLPAGQTPVEWKGYTFFNKIADNGVYLLRVVDEGNKKFIGKGKIFVIKR